MYEVNQTGYKLRFFKNLKAAKAVMDAINLIEYKLNKIENLREWHYNIGYLEALKEFGSKSTRNISKEITSLNEELKLINEDFELFEMHHEYLKGYRDGCVKLLKHIVFINTCLLI